MRKEKIIKDEYYHIINRGNNKQSIFLDEKDRIRFLFLILYFQSPVNFDQINRSIKYFIKHQLFNISEKIIKNIIDNRYVELVNFTLMPNHFHLILKEHKKNGISNYMQRVLNSYTKYFNTRHEVIGHLFQGPFKSIHIKDDPQLLYLSAYIHNNVRELKRWRGKEHLYSWSSYQDCTNNNRWEELLKTDIIMKQFPNKERYKLFVQKGGAKDIL